MRPTLRASTIAAALLLAACSPSDGAASTTTTTTVPVAAHSDDGVLVLGVLLPASGPGAEIGMSMREGAQVAVDEINAAGGVGGQPVIVKFADEGDSSATAARSLADLLDFGVDAMVGPASSLIAATTLPVTTEAGVLTCSPSATALQLSEFPDRGLFIRTIPSDALEAAAMANLMEQTGYRTASVVFVDDSYGRDFADAIATNLDAQGIDVTNVVAYDPSDEDYLDEASAIVGTNLVAVVGDNESGTRMVKALFDAGSDDLEVVVNDAMRVPSTPRTYRGLSETDRSHLRGVSPAERIPSSAFAATFMEENPDSRGLFATNAYDCVNAMALSANAVGRTDGTAIVQQLVSVTSNGTSCASFPSCDALRASGRDINYDGPSGQLDLSVDGEAERATFDVFGYDANGKDVSIDVISG